MIKLNNCPRCGMVGFKTWKVYHEHLASIHPLKSIPRGVRREATTIDEIADTLSSYLTGLSIPIPTRSKAETVTLMEQCIKDNFELAGYASPIIGRD